MPNWLSISIKDSRLGIWFLSLNIRKVLLRADFELVKGFRGCFLNQFPLFCQMKSRDFIKSERIFRQNECQNHYLRVVMGWQSHPITTLR
jgi:hypothetical protein